MTKKLAKKLTRGPQPPVNVRLVLDDDTELPVECVYDGVFDGMHRWTAVHRGPIDLHRVRAIRADVVPGRTAIRIGIVR